MSTTRPLHVVVLDPEPETVATREAGRGKRGYGAAWSPQRLVEDFRRTTPRIGLWLDTTAQTPEETVHTILSRLHEARVSSTS